jgi:hypothetical protein
MSQRAKKPRHKAGQAPGAGQAGLCDPLAVYIPTAMPSQGAATAPSAARSTVYNPHLLSSYTPAKAPSAAEPKNVAKPLDALIKRPMQPPPQPAQSPRLTTTGSSAVAIVPPPSHARGARARFALSASTKPAVHPRLSRRQRPMSFESVFGVEESPPSALLQQLARCSASSDTLIRDMRKIQTRFDRSEVVLKLSTRYLLVGTCDSRFAGLAHFLPTKVVYAFEHPQHRHVEMHMRYEDMLGVRLQPASTGGANGSGASSGRATTAGVTIGGGSAAQLEFRFRIGAPLAYFSREYDHNNTTHDLRIGFLSAADLRQFEQLVLPHVHALADGAAAGSSAPSASADTGSAPLDTGAGSAKASATVGRRGKSLSATS